MPNSRRAPDTLAYSLMLLLTIIWGSQQVVIKLLSPNIVPVLQIISRSIVVALILLAYILWRHGRNCLPRDTWAPGALAGVLFAVEFIAIAEGLRLTSASHMVVFLYTSPMFTAIGLHFLVEQERMSRLQWIGMTIAIGGIAVAFLGPGSADDSSSLAGDLLALLAGATWGLSTVVIRHSRLSALHAQGNMFYQMLFTATLATVYLLWSGQSLATHWDNQSIALMGFQIFVLALGSYLGWFWLLRVYKATRIATLALLTPLFGVAFGVLLLDEPLSLGFLIGTALVLGGIVVVRVGES